jgi:hypothetical protein
MVVKETDSARSAPTILLIMLDPEPEGHNVINKIPTICKCVRFSVVPIIKPKHGNNKTCDVTPIKPALGFLTSILKSFSLALIPIPIIIINNIIGRR